jgi:hypothetical protein
MTLPSLDEIVHKALSAFKRFPVVLIWILLGSFFCVYIIEVDSPALFNKHGAAVLTLILGISWFIGLQFYLEQTREPRKWAWTKLVLLALLGLFHYHLPNLSQNDDPTYIIRFFLYLLAGHLFVLFAPFILKWQKEAYWNYLAKVATAIGRSLLFSGILYLGLVLALLAIKFLFDHELDPKRYGQLFVLCAGIVNTWIYLSDFPKDIFGTTQVRFGKPLEVMVKYILIPLAFLYLIILYAYGIKIIIAWELPKGWVSYLVSTLALLGFTVQMIITSVQKSDKSWAFTKFYPWFHLLMCPLIILLFIAIIRRILDYGITENRYFVLVMALWILANTLYLLISKKKLMKVLPISLCILAMITSFGPWGAFSTSKKSQVHNQGA